ncbi:nephrin-like isoform X3 [Lineus longissimus]|uniref:nephrin-like isoform X3 n=1 Tax=Lineus longissimus TaxID=88925 RepID=UPI00315DB5B4
MAKSLQSLFLILLTVYCQVQSFRVKPNDTIVVQGQTIILKCEVENQQGRVQWTKDGFALGFSRDVPGYSRYSMVGDESRGVYNLKIVNVALGDDALYECQVGPSSGHPPIKTRATLSVAVPPDVPVISGQSNGSIIEVLPTQRTLELICESRNGKPAATITWLRNGKKITTDEIKYSIQDTPNKRQNARSVLTIKPKREDNGATYSCQAINFALSKPLESVVLLSVLHPPSHPVITGYKSGDVVRTGDRLTLSCTSRGGNPLATVIWYKNGKELDDVYDKKMINMAVNKLELTAQQSDNLAKYSCIAKNVVTESPMEASVVLSVQFAPEKVVITGETGAKAGESITLTCETTNSNPASTIKWFAKGRQLGGDSSSIIPSPDGGFITRSQVTVKLSDSENKVIYTCQATSSGQTMAVADSVTLEVQYPPEKPVISGYKIGTPINEGNIQRLTCVSVGGNPHATLTWWKGNTELQSKNTIVGNIASSELSIKAVSSDNMAEYRCNATNPATSEPLISTVVLTVYFPPKSLTVTTEPTVGKAGKQMKIICETESSNPPAQITWWKDGRELVGRGKNIGIIDGAYGGKRTRNSLTLRVDEDDHDSEVSCEALNDELEMSTNRRVLISVLFAPKFPKDTAKKVSIQEGMNYILNLTAKANPKNTSYTWYKDGVKLVTSSLWPNIVPIGPILNMTSIRRSNGGKYLCMALNDEGSGNITINVDVQFPAEISRLTTPVYVDQGQTAAIDCEAEANPITDDIITWSRPGYNMNKTLTNTIGGASKLIVYNSSKKDSGKFRCTANNGIGDSSSFDAELVVKYPPEIDKSERHIKFAAAKGTRGELICRAEGAPVVTFFWTRNGEDIIPRYGSRYELEGKEIDWTHHLGYLYISNVTDYDYGMYHCRAVNSLGKDTVAISFETTTRPDPPEDLRHVNSTHDSITVMWTSGFNGGLYQWFRIKYEETRSMDPPLLINVNPPSANMFTVPGLKFATEYTLYVQAINKLGDSRFSQSAKCSTSSIPPKDEQIAQGDEVPLLIIVAVCAVAMVVLGLNVCLILYLIRRRKRKMQKGTPPQKEAEHDSQSNTIEMYAPPGSGNVYPNPLPEDTKTYSSYDRSLDDFNDDLYKSYHDDESDDTIVWFPRPDFSKSTCFRKYGGPLVVPDETYPLKGGGPYSPARSDISSTGTDSPHASLINSKSKKTYIDDSIVASNKVYNKAGSLPRNHHTNGPIENDYHDTVSKTRSLKRDREDANRNFSTFQNHTGQNHQNHINRTKTPPPPPVRSTSHPRGPHPAPPPYANEAQSSQRHLTPQSVNNGSVPPPPREIMAPSQLGRPQIYQMQGALV